MSTTKRITYQIHKEGGPRDLLINSTTETISSFLDNVFFFDYYGPEAMDLDDRITDYSKKARMYISTKSGSQLYRHGDMTLIYDILIKNPGYKITIFRN